MNQDADPKSKPTPPAEGEAEHHLIEDIREEITHAVEHVPKPVRWTARKLFLLVVIGLVALVVIAVVSALLYFANRTELVAQELTVFLNGTLARRSDVVVEIDDIRGNPLTGVRLIQPRIRFRDGGGATLLEAPSMILKYSALNLWRGRQRTIDVTLENPVVRLSRGSNGKIRLPLWKSSGATSRPDHGYDVHLRIHRGSLVMPPPERGIEGLELDSFVSTSAVTHAQIARLAWKSGFFETRDLNLTGEISAGDSVLFRVRQLRTADLALTADGAWKKGESRRLLHMNVDRVRWRWLSRAIPSKTFDVPGEGRVQVDLRVDETAWNGAFATAADWDSLPIEARGNFRWAAHVLTVQPLAGHTPAGDLDGRLIYAKTGWEVGGAARRANPARWQFIGIRGWPAGNLNGSFRYAVDNHRHEGVARLDASLEESEMEGWKADRAAIVVNFPAVGPDSFTVHMERRGGEATLRGTSNASGWGGSYVAAALPLDEWPAGRASGIRGMLGHGEGTVQGGGGRLSVTGTLNGTMTDWLGIHTARWRLESVNGALLPVPDLTADAHLADLMFLGVHFDTAGVGFHLGDRVIQLGSITARARDTTMTAAGGADWSDQGWHLRLERAEARSEQFHWVAEPPMLFAGDPKGVTFERFEARDSSSALAIEGRWAAPDGVFDWRARGRDLDVGRLGMPREWGLSGNAIATLEIKGAYSDPHWSFDGAWSRPGWQGHRADSLAVKLEGGPGTLVISRGAMRLDGGELDAAGRIEGAAHAWPDTLNGPGLTRWLASAARWSGEVRSRDLPLDHLESITPAANGWRGRASGTLAVAGSPSRPELRLAAEVKPLEWKGYTADDLTLKASYRDGRLEVPELHMNRGDLVSTVEGEMPLELRLGVRPKVPESPMSWRFEIPNGDLAVLPQFVPQIGSASGRFELHATLRGTAQHPDLVGALRVNDGRVRPAGREEVLNDVHAALTLDESRITLDTLTATQGKSGRVRATGAVELAGFVPKSYRFDLSLAEFTALETGVYAAVFGGDFVVTNGPKIGGQVVPFVTGNVNLERAVVLFDFANQSEVQQYAAAAEPLFWTYRVQVTASHNLHWQPPDGDIEFSANLSLEQTPTQLLIYGDMTSLRGTYYFLSNRFTVNQANLTFDNIGGVNPLIDASATTRIKPSEVGVVNGGGEEAHDVTVLMKGRAKEPAIEFASDPSDWDEARILRELTIGRFITGNSVTLGDPLDNYLTRAINKTLSAEMSRAFRGYINEWEIQREGGGLVAGQGDVILGVGSNITPSLALRYRQRLPGLSRGATTTGATAVNPFERDVEAEYRINRFFYVTTELTQRRILTGGASPVTNTAPDFNVNLKARWEY
jgi:hypothetical protein